MCLLTLLESAKPAKSCSGKRGLAVAAIVEVALLSPPHLATEDLSYSGSACACSRSPGGGDFL